jgi:hypothetical protein
MQHRMMTAAFLLLAGLLAASLAGFLHIELYGFSAAQPFAPPSGDDESLLSTTPSDGKSAIPPIDAMAPSKIETATFALG